MMKSPLRLSESVEKKTKHMLYPRYCKGAQGAARMTSGALLEALTIPAIPSPGYLQTLFLLRQTTITSTSYIQQEICFFTSSKFNWKPHRKGLFHYLK